MSKGTYYNVFSTITTKDVIKEQQNAIFFHNRGTNPVTINNTTFNTGDFVSISDETGAIDITEYKINFLENGGTNNLFVIRKIYK